MDTYIYQRANTTDNEIDDVKFTRRYFFRQLFVCSGAICIYFVNGLYFGAPTVTIPQLRKEANSTAAVSDEMASWLSSIHGYSSIPWIFILPVLSDSFGRKVPFIFASLIVILGYLVFCFSNTVIHILISEILIGIIIGCCLIIGIVIVSEYTSVKYRGLFLTIKSATFFWGIWVANTIGTFFYWKNIGILALVCCTYTLTSFYWPESPYWLAANGRFEECAISHRWLKGTNVEAEKELENLIISQTEYLANRLQRDTTIWNRVHTFYKTIRQKAFCKSVSLSMATLLLYKFSGKMMCSIYALEILKKITRTESTAYVAMLILDAVSISSMYFGCYLCRKFNRRTLLFTGSSIAVFVLCTLSLYLYLVKLTYISNNNIVTILLLSLFTVGVGCGPMILLTSIYAELIPLRFKNTALFVTNFLNSVLMGTTLKLGPLLFKTFGIHGTFFIFSVIDAILLLILAKYLPETKNKTLQEIEEYFLK